MRYCTGCGKRYHSTHLNKYYLCNYCTKKKSHLKRKYNLSLEEYNQLLHKQDDSCAICKRTMSTLPISLAVDHDHKTNRVRGLLCNACNAALGLLKDSKLLLNRALSYLDKSET